MGLLMTAFLRLLWYLLRIVSIKSLHRGPRSRLVLFIKAATLPFWVCSESKQSQVFLPPNTSGNESVVTNNHSHKLGPSLPLFFNKLKCKSVPFFPRDPKTTGIKSTGKGQEGIIAVNSRTKEQKSDVWVLKNITHPHTNHFQLYQPAKHAPYNPYFSLEVAEEP